MRPPSRPMMLAVARPMPLAAAVISATLPLNRIAFLPSLVVALARRISPAGQKAMLDRARPSRQQLHARRRGAVKPLPCAHSSSPAPAVGATRPGGKRYPGRLPCPYRDPSHLIGAKCFLHVASRQGGRPMQFELDYSKLIPLDAEALAEGGIAEAYKELLPALVPYVKEADEIHEVWDNGYSVRHRDREYVIYKQESELGDEQAARNWGNAT